MNEIIIRKAMPEDVPAINHIKNYYIINTDYSLSYEPDTLEHTRDWLELYSDKFPILVAVTAEGDVAGWGSLTTFRTTDGYCKSPELSLYVREDFHRRGIGGKLMDALEREGRLRGFHCIVSVITESNAISVNMHKKFGFETCGVLKETGYKNGKYLDVIFMTKIIG